MNDADIRSKGFIKQAGAFLRRYVYLIPFILIEAFVIITMSASLDSFDTVLLSISVISSILTVITRLFTAKSISRLTAVWVFAAPAALILDVIFAKREFTAPDIAVIAGICVAVIFAVTKSGRKKLLSAAGCITITLASVLGTVAIYTAVGKHFLPYDPILVLLCHVCAVLSLVLSYYKPVCHKAVKLCLGFVVPFTAFLLLEFLTHNPFADINTQVFLLNTALFLLFFWMLFFILGRSTPAMIITVLLPLILGLVSYFTVEFRGTPLFPWDLASYGIAATVLGGYDLTIPPSVALVCSCAVCVCTCAVLFGFRLSSKKSYFIRPVAAIMILCVLVCTGSYLQTDRAIDELDLYPHLFVPHHLYKTNGFTVSFLMNLRYTTVEKPDGYSEDGVTELAGDYTSDSISENTERPNVIVVMNESFADMKALCGFDTNTEYMPFIDSLQENALKGDLHVSIVGGNTPNSEFEFLTGMTMGFLPSGSIPYQQFVKSECPTLATQFESLGYHTVAMHPYWAEGWKREIVYPLMGFEEMHFLDYDTYGSFNEYPRIRDYISDESLYDKIRTSYEENADGEPLFIFAVTMQNHSGYSQRYDNFDPQVKVTGLEDNFELSTYMSLVRESDAAFAGLIEYFENADEPTVILMFGDHQPNDSIAYPLMNQSGTVYDDGDIEGSEKRFTVPYIMWANYELDAEAPKEMSLNYLSALLMDAAGLPKTAFQKFALDLMADIPVITGRCLKTADTSIYPVSDHVLYEKLVSYSHLQYSYLFDSTNTPKGFWTLKK